MIGLRVSSRDVDINDVFSHELAPIPTSMFTEVGEMRISKAKSVLKKQLQVSARHASNTDVTISMVQSCSGWFVGQEGDSEGICEQFQRSH